MHHLHVNAVSPTRRHPFLLVAKRYCDLFITNNPFLSAQPTICPFLLSVVSIFFYFTYSHSFISRVWVGGFFFFFLPTVDDRPSLCLFPLRNRLHLCASLHFRLLTVQLYGVVRFHISIDFRQMNFNEGKHRPCIHPTLPLPLVEYTELDRGRRRGWKKHTVCDVSPRASFMVWCVLQLVQKWMENGVWLETHWSMELSIRIQADDYGLVLGVKKKTGKGENRSKGKWEK